MESSDVLLKLWDVERQLGVSRATLYRWCKGGSINFVRLPSGDIRVPSSEVARLKQNKEEAHETVVVNT